MSTEIEKDILCPQCGQSQKYRLYASINAKENPELKRRVLSETLFDWRYKRCNYFAAMAYSFLYTDPEAGYIVCVAPGGEAAPPSHPGDTVLHQAGGKEPGGAEGKNPHFRFGL